MSLFSDITNGINNAVDTAQNVMDSVADTAQGAARAAVDAVQGAANAGVDAFQDGMMVAAGVYDSLLGTNVFSNLGATANTAIDIEQDVANRAIDTAQDLADVVVDSAQSAHRDVIDLYQYAATAYPKLIDDLLGDGSVNMPGKPVSVQVLEDLINQA